MAKTTYVELESGTVLETETPNIWPEGKRLSAREGRARLETEAREYLLSIIKPGDTIYTILRHRSASGIFRRISLMVQTERGPQIIDGYAAHLGIGRRTDKEGLGVPGCGMDMGFHLVYALSSKLFPVFNCVGERCPSNDHNNGDRDHKPHKHSDGGYALKHSWI